MEPAARRVNENGVHTGSLVSLLQGQSPCTRLMDLLLLKGGKKDPESDLGLISVYAPPPY